MPSLEGIKRRDQDSRRRFPDSAGCLRRRSRTGVEIICLIKLLMVYMDTKGEDSQSDGLVQLSKEWLESKQTIATDLIPDPIKGPSLSQCSKQHSKKFALRT